MSIFGHKLTERQLKICQEKGLPTEWRKMKPFQRQCLTAIEEMLQYLDDKYGKKFCYEGYVPENKIFMDEEYLCAYAEGDDPETDLFTVKRDGKGFKDGYAWVQLAPVVQKEMDEKLGPILEGETYKMFTKLIGVSDEGIVKAMNITIYIENPDDNVTEALFEKVVDKVEGDTKVSDIVLYSFDKTGITSDMNKKNHESFDVKEVKHSYLSLSVDRKKNGARWIKK